MVAKLMCIIEQPLKKGNQSCLLLFERSPLPLYADESIQRISDIESVKDCFMGSISNYEMTGMNEAHQYTACKRTSLKDIGRVYDEKFLWCFCSCTIIATY